MKRTVFSHGLALGVALGVALAVPAVQAQDQAQPQGQAQQGQGGGPGGGGPGGGGPGGGGRMDPAQWRQRFMDRIKESLEVSNEEWMAIEPLVTAVSEKQRQAGMGRMGGMFGGDRRRGGDNQPQGPTEVQDLRDALEKKDTPAADLQAKLKALRDMRQKQETELKAAREELRKVLTARQEAQLVLFGMLD